MHLYVYFIKPEWTAKRGRDDSLKKTLQFYMCKKRDMHRGRDKPIAILNYVTKYTLYNVM